MQLLTINILQSDENDKCLTLLFGWWHDCTGARWRSMECAPWTPMSWIYGKAWTEWVETWWQHRFALRTFIGLLAGESSAAALLLSGEKTRGIRNTWNEKTLLTQKYSVVLCCLCNVLTVLRLLEPIVQPKSRFFGGGTGTQSKSESVSTKINTLQIAVNVFAFFVFVFCTWLCIQAFTVVVNHFPFYRGRYLYRGRYRCPRRYRYTTNSPSIRKHCWTKVMQKLFRTTSLHLHYILTNLYDFVNSN